MSETIFYWSAEGGPLGWLRLAASEAGLCKLALGRENDEDFRAWLARAGGWRRLSLVQRQTRLIEQALDELHAYLSGRSRALGTALDLWGTPFQRRVWAEVATIPYGAMATYGEIAARIGRPKAMRAVGAANGANPVPIFVPCHRVVGADGALRGYGGGLEIKAALLKLEHVSLIEADVPTIA